MLTPLLVVVLCLIVFCIVGMMESRSIQYIYIQNKDIKLTHSLTT